MLSPKKASIAIPLSYVGLSESLQPKGTTTNMLMGGLIGSTLGLAGGTVYGLFQPEWFKQKPWYFLLPPALFGATEGTIWGYVWPNILEPLVRRRIRRQERERMQKEQEQQEADEQQKKAAISFRPPTTALRKKYGPGNLTIRPGGLARKQSLTSPVQNSNLNFAALLKTFGMKFTPEQEQQINRFGAGLINILFGFRQPGYGQFGFGQPSLNYSITPRAQGMPQYSTKTSHIKKAFLPPVLRGIVLGALLGTGAFAIRPLFYGAKSERPKLEDYMLGAVTGGAAGGSIDMMLQLINSLKKGVI